MTPITIEHIKAARVLLRWGQARLAGAAGISLPALGNLERGAVSPRLKTLNAIRKALEDAGVEFLEGPGVRLQREVLKIEMLEGDDAVKKLFADFYLTLQAEGGELLVRGVSDQRFMKVPATREALVGYLRKVHQHPNLSAKLLVCEGDTYFFGKRTTTIYRWVDKNVFGHVPCYIYRDKYAVLLWGPPLRVVIVQNSSLAETYRKQFQADWKNARIPPREIPYRWTE